MEFYTNQNSKEALKVEFNYRFNANYSQLTPSNKTLVMKAVYSAIKSRLMEASKFLSESKKRSYKSETSAKYIIDNSYFVANSILMYLQTVEGDIREYSVVFVCNILNWGGSVDSFLTEMIKYQAGTIANGMLVLPDITTTYDLPLDLGDLLPLEGSQVCNFNEMANNEVLFHNSVRQKLIRDIQINADGSTSVLGSALITGGLVSVKNFKNNPNEQIFRVVTNKELPVFSEKVDISNKIRLSVNTANKATLASRSVSQMGKIQIFKSYISASSSSLEFLHQLGFTQMVGYMLMDTELFRAFDNLIYDHIKVFQNLVKSVMDSGISKVVRTSVDVDVDAYNTEIRKHWEEEWQKAYGQPYDPNNPTPPEPQEQVNYDERNAAALKEISEGIAKLKTQFESIKLDTSNASVGINTTNLDGKTIGIDTTKLLDFINANKLQISVDQLKTLLEQQGIKVNTTDLTTALNKNINVNASELDGKTIRTIVDVSGNVTASLDPNASVKIAEGGEVKLSETSVDGINKIAEHLKTANDNQATIEKDRVIREINADKRAEELHANKKKLIDNQATNIDRDNIIAENEKVITSHKKSAMNQSVEGKNYTERVAEEYKQKHGSEVIEEYTTSEGVKEQIKQGAYNNVKTQVKQQIETHVKTKTDNDVDAEKDELDVTFDWDLLKGFNMLVEENEDFNELIDDLSPLTKVTGVAHDTK